jgi:hypothetical protein
MWLSIVSAWACEPELELLTWIPEDGALPKGALIRAESTAVTPTAEAHGPEEAVFQLEERGDPPEGWTAWALPSELSGDTWEIQVYEGAQLLDTVDILVDAEAEGGSLEEDFQLAAVVWTELTDEPPYLLCDTAYEGEWVEVSVELELPASPGPGWVLQLSEKAEPQTWAAWPTYGGTFSDSYIVHWTLQESCPRVTVRDPFGEEQANLRLDCTLLPKPADDGSGGGYTQNRFDEVCGCSSVEPAGALSWLLLVLAGAALRRGPAGGRAPRRGDPRSR